MEFWCEGEGKDELILLGMGGCGWVVVEAAEAVTTAIKTVISPANALNNAKNGIKYRGHSFAVSESKI